MDEVIDEFEYKLDITDNYKESGLSFNILAMSDTGDSVLYNEVFVQMNTSRVRFWIILGKWRK